MGLESCLLIIGAHNNFFCRKAEKLSKEPKSQIPNPDNLSMPRAFFILQAGDSITINVSASFYYNRTNTWRLADRAKPSPLLCIACLHFLTYLGSWVALARMHHTTGPATTGYYSARIPSILSVCDLQAR